MNQNDFLNYCAEYHETELTPQAAFELAQAVINQAGGWSLFCDIAPDVIRGGASGGFYGFTYSGDCAAFVKGNLEDVMEIAFDSLPYLREKASYPGMLTDLLAWFTLEKVADWFADYTKGRCN